jgi:hypothetical protein
MSKTNSLTTHHGESRTSRVDKMSGHGKKFLSHLKGKSKRFLKKFYGKKRRSLLKNINSDKV